MINLKVKKSDLLIFLVVICDFEISWFSFISLPVKLLYLALQSALIGYGVANIVLRKRFETADALLAIYIVIEFISTVLNREELKELILNTKTLLLLYVSYRWAYETKPRLFIRLASRYSLLLTLINTISAIVCYPRGLFYYSAYTPSFVIGADNTSTRIYILSLVFCFLEHSLNSNKRHLNIFTICLLNFIVFVFVRDIGNGKMCAIVFVLAYIVFQIFNISLPKRPMCKIIVANYILAFMLTVLNRIDIFSFIIVNILHRDLTLTTRTTIWRITINKIVDKPIIGNGYMSGEQFESMLPSIIGINAHNTILMIAFIGGIVLSITFIWLLLASTAKYDNESMSDRLWMIPVAFLGMFLRSQVEGGDAVYLIAMAILISGFVECYDELVHQ